MWQRGHVVRGACCHCLTLFIPLATLQQLASQGLSTLWSKFLALIAVITTFGTYSFCQRGTLPSTFNPQCTSRATIVKKYALVQRHDTVL